MSLFLTLNRFMSPHKVDHTGQSVLSVGHVGPLNLNLNVTMVKHECATKNRLLLFWFNLSVSNLLYTSLPFRGSFRSLIREPFTRAPTGLLKGPCIAGVTHSHFRTSCRIELVPSCIFDTDWFPTSQ